VKKCQGVKIFVGFNLIWGSTNFENPNQNVNFWGPINVGVRQIWESTNLWGIGIFHSVPFIYAFSNSEFKTQLLDLIRSATLSCCSVGKRNKEDIQPTGTDTEAMHNLAVSSA
jgi:hypothetical protein